MFKVSFKDIDLGWNALTRGLRDAEKLGLEVGVFADQGVHPRTKKPLPDVAAAVEFGDGADTPPRPIFTTIVEANKSRYADLSGRAIKNILGGADGNAELMVVGNVIANDVKHAMDAFADPKNAESTKKRKGADNPWIETGTVRDAVEARVKSTGVRATKSKRGRLLMRDRKGRFA